MVIFDKDGLGIVTFCWEDRREHERRVLLMQRVLSLQKLATYTNTFVLMDSGGSCIWNSC